MIFLKGGGLGGTRIGGPDQNQKYSGREGSYAVHTTHPPPSVYEREYRYSRGVPVSSNSSYGYGSGRYGSRHSSGGYGGGYDRDYSRRRRSRSRSPRREDRY